MNNAEIIGIAKKLNGIEEEVHTFAEWKKRGSIVRKGEHAAFKARIWLPTREQVEVEPGVFQWVERFTMKQASFFGFSQVEAVER